ncbi:MAG: hypothetical protein ACLQIB_54245, partial [Isosphaeraceae bacterium]
MVYRTAAFWRCMPLETRFSLRRLGRRDSFPGNDAVVGLWDRANRNETCRLAGPRSGPIPSRSHPTGAGPDRGRRRDHPPRAVAGTAGGGAADE